MGAKPCCKELREPVGELCCVHELFEDTFMLPRDYD